MNKKKKSSKKSKESKDSEAAEEGGEPAPAADGEFDPTALKKKKKKKVAKPAEDEFEAKLAEAGVNENGEAADDTGAKTAPELEEMGGDMFQGTGIWSHNEEKPIVYDKLLERFFALLHSAHPDLLSSGTKSYVVCQYFSKHIISSLTLRTRSLLLSVFVKYFSPSSISI